MAVNAPRIKRDARGLLLLDPDSRAILVRVRDNAITGDIPLRLTSTLHLASTLTLGPYNDVQLAESGGGLVISSHSGVSLSGLVSVDSLTVGGDVQLAGSGGKLVISSPSGVSLSGPVSVDSLTVGGSASSSASLNCPVSVDHLTVGGSETGPGLELAEEGNMSASTYADSGAAWADNGTPAFVAGQKYLRLSIGNTVYRIPLWADPGSL